MTNETSPNIGHGASSRTAFEFAPESSEPIFTLPSVLAPPAEIAAAIPSLVTLHDRARAAGFEPAGVVMPKRLDPGPYKGPDATEHPATFMGMPITWGDSFGIILPIS